MARIKTKAALREYTLRQMGSPTIRVELTEEQLDDCITKSLDRYGEYAYDGQKTGTLLVTLEPDTFKYTLPDNVIAVTGLRASSTYSSFINIPAGYTLAMNPLTLNYLDNVSNIDIQSMTERMAKMSTLRALFDVEPNFDFNSNSKELIFFEKPTSTVAVLEIAMDYEPLEVDNIYNDQWVKKRVLGEAFVLWSNVTGKYSNSLVNGSTINYSDIQQKGQDLIDQTEEELFEIGEPLGIYVF